MNDLVPRGYHLALAVLIGCVLAVAIADGGRVAALIGCGCAGLAATEIYRTR